MKDASGPVTVTGNLDTSNSEELTIHAGAIGKLMAMFSNQYSNGPLAVIREYFCNGDDSRIAAGSDRPTEVLLPTELNPVLQVRDYGLGLDKDGLFSVFSTYGMSSKDETNDATGHFGIGSKAAFTLASQFIVTGFKDGVRTTVLFYLDAKGVARRSVQFEGPTEESNGVLVEVGIPDVEALNRSAREFFLTVPKGRALVNGEPPEHMSDNVEFTRFNEEVTLVKDGQGRIRLQMGPVVYRVTREILRAVVSRLEGLPSQEVANALVEWHSTDSVLMEVGMGEVTIAPSREDLRDTDATLNRVAAIVQGIHDYIVTGIQSKIDAAPSNYQAALVLKHAMEDLRGFRVKKSAFTYHGATKAFKTEVTLEHPVFFLTKKTWRSQNMVVAREDKHTVDFERVEKTLVITGVSRDEVSRVSRYAKRFLENREDVRWIMVSDQEAGEAEWFQYGTDTGAPSMTLVEYRAALRAMRDGNPVTRREPSYTVGWNVPASRDVDDRELLSDIISWGKPLIVFHDTSRVYDARVQEILEGKFTPVVLLGQQSLPALIQRVEQDGSVEVFTGDWKAVVRETLEAEIPAPTEDERIALGASLWLQEQQGSFYRSNNGNWAQRLQRELGVEEFARITSPIVQRVADEFELAELLTADLTQERRVDLQRLCTWAGVEFAPVPYESENKTVREHFPLLTDGIQWHVLRRDTDYRDALIEYINSKS